MKKLLIFGQNLKFVKNYLSFLSEHFEIKILEQDEGSLRDKETFLKWANWSDIILIEWLIDYAFEIANLDLNKKIYIRMHRYECFEKPIQKLNIKNISGIIVVSDFFKELLNQKHKIPINKIFTIPNAINCENFSTEKEKDYIKNIGFVEFYTSRKRIDLAYKIIKKLPKHNFIIAGKNPLIEKTWISQKDILYLEKNLPKIEINTRTRFVGQQNLTEFYKRIGFVLVTSDNEAHPVSCTEAFASSTAVLVLQNKKNYWGAEKVFSNDFIFSSKRQIVKKIKSLTKNKTSYDEYVNLCREEICAKYDIKQIRSKWVELF